MKRADERISLSLSLEFFIRTVRLFSVFSRRFSSEKCPTLTVASFFLFFSSDYNLTLIGPLFLQSKLLKLLPLGQVRSAEISGNW